MQHKKKSDSDNELEKNWLFLDNIASTSRSLSNSLVMNEKNSRTEMYCLIKQITNGERSPDVQKVQRWQVWLESYHHWLYLEFKPLNNAMLKCIIIYSILDAI